MRKIIKLCVVCAFAQMAAVQSRAAQQVRDGAGPCVAGPFMVFFDPNSSELTSSAKTILDNTASAYATCGKAQVTIQGHTDRTGSDEANLALSARIAETVRTYLLRRGIPEATITTKAFGETRPLVATDDGAAEPQNRRAEITFGSGGGWDDLSPAKALSEGPRPASSDSSVPQQTKVRVVSSATAATAAKQHPMIVEEFGGELSGERGAYVRSVAAKVTDRTNIAGGAAAFRVTTLNSPVMNAFAVPGGYLYITRQLLALANDEAELAFIVGHEAAHIASRHSSERKRAGILSQILAVGLGAVTGSSQLGNLAGQMTQGVVLRYSREQELEADDLGVRYLSEAGYDPLGSARFLGSLGAAASLEARSVGRRDERSTPSWARSHPLSADRVKRATVQANETGRVGKGLRDRDRFLARLDGLMVDDDPKQGVIDGRWFKHPDLRLGFEVPEGYGMQNGVRAVTIVGQQGQAQFGGGRYSGSLSDYIAQAFKAVAGGQVSFSQARGTTLNGIESAYSTAKVATQSGQVDLTVFAYAWDANTAYHFTMITPAGSGLGPFNEMVQSLRRLSSAEAAAIRPRVIDIVTVGKTDTVESLADRMAYKDLKADRFRILNGLSASDKLVPGQKVKLVVFGTR